MQKRPTRFRTIFTTLARIVLALALVLPGSLLPTVAQAQSAPTAVRVQSNVPLYTELFVDQPVGTCEDTGDYIVRTRPVDINFGALENELSSGIAEVVGLNLFDTGGITVTLTALFDEVQLNPDGFTWRGHIAEDPHSTVLLSAQVLDVEQNIRQLIGAIYTLDATYQIGPSPDGANHCVAEVDQDALMFNEDDAEEPPADSLATVNSAAAYAPAVAADDGSLIDVLVVYSTDAKNEAGGTAAIEAVARAYVDLTNQANANSAVNHRMWLAHSAEVSYARLTCARTDDCHSTDLARLTTNNDGFLDEVHTLRNTYHADIVLWIARDKDPYSTGGVAWVAGGDSAANSSESQAFGLGTLGCARGLCFLHEAGHILGVNHEWFESASPIPFAHGHGHVDTVAGFRTILAYGTYCLQIGAQCAWVPHFSNPNISIKGRPTGIAIGAPTDCQKGVNPAAPCAADAASVLNTTDKFVAAFRSSQTVWTGNNSTDWNDPANWTINEGAAANPTAVQRVPRGIDDVLIPAAPAGAKFPIIGADASVRNLTIADGATVGMNNGTLTVNGQWEEQGAGRFNATGGTVLFAGRLPQTIKLNNRSNLPSVQVGDGGAARVKLASNLDINGALTIKKGATLDASAGGYTLRIDGNWSDEGTGFVTGNSHVIFDGATQTVDKATSTTLLSENFEQFTQQCTSELPTGWQSDPAHSFCAGALIQGEPRKATLFGGPLSAWLISLPLDLKPGVNYQLDYKSVVEQIGGAPGAEKITVKLGQAPNGAALTQDLDAATIAHTTLTPRTANFTVSTAGTYYLGFRAESPNGNAVGFDDIMLTGAQNITFHDATVATGTTTFSQDVRINNNLTVAPGATANFGAKTVNVEGTVTNNGALKQIKDAPANATTNLLLIQNSAKNQDKYYGVEITPGAALGETVVEVRGNQSSCTGTMTDPLMRRCFTITPATPGAATIKFWYTEAERNSQEADKAEVQQYGGGLTQIGTNTTRSEAASTCQSGGGAACWVQAESINDYSKSFGLGNNVTPQTHALTVNKAGAGAGKVTSAPAGIDCGANCTFTFSAGTGMALTPVAEAGSIFTGWSGDCTGTGACTVTMDAAKTVNATFDTAAAPTFALTVNKAGTGAGKVTSAPAGIDCGNTCTFTFNAGDKITLTPTPNAGSTFTGWSGACTGTGACTINMDAAKNVTATFDPGAPQTLTVTKAGTGASKVTSAPAGIDCGNTCTFAFTTGDKVTLTPNADAGSRFTGWSGDCTGAGACSVTMDAAKTINATFDTVPAGQQPLAVTKAGNGSGKVTSTPAGIDCGNTCTASLAENTVVTLDAAADAGATFAGWSGDCTGTGTCQVTLTTAKNVVATFNAVGALTQLLTVDKQGAGAGKVTSAPAGIDCGTACILGFPQDAQVTLVATPDADSTFTGWGGFCNGTGSCQVTMADARTVTANFNKKSGGSDRLLNGDFAQGQTAWTDPNFLNGVPDNPAVPGRCSAGEAEIASAFAKGKVGQCLTLNASATGWSVGAKARVLEGGARAFAYLDAAFYTSSDCSGNAAHNETLSTLARANENLTRQFTYDAKTNKVNSILVTLGADDPDGDPLAGGAVAACFDDVTFDPASAAAQTHELTVTKAGAGTGKVTSTPAGIDCGNTCNSKFAPNAQVTLTATADAGSTFAGWSGACTGTAACQVTMDAAKTVIATFNTAGAQTQTLTVTKAGNGAGKVTSTPAGIDCGNACSFAFVQNDQVNLTATADPGSTFVGWSGACTGTAACQVTMDAAKTVIATFNTAGAQTQTLTVTKAGDGTGKVTSAPVGIDCGNACSFGFVANAQVTLTATTDAGSTFAGWSGDCTGTGACQVTMAAAKTVTATFTKQTANQSIYLPLIQH